MTDNNHDRPPDEHYASILEAILFASGDPVSIDSLSEALGGIPAEDLETAMDGLCSRYSGASGGLQIEKVAGGFRIATRSEIGGWVRQYFRNQNKTRLTPATLEVLAIVAYRQPVTSPEIQSIRQKDATYGLKVLLEKRLIRIMGRKKSSGESTFVWHIQTLPGAFWSGLPQGPAVHRGVRRLRRNSERWSKLPA